MSKILKKYPFYKQTGIKDCGPACLSMITKYYGGSVDIEKLQEMSNTTKKGTTAFDLIKAANEIGFMAKGVKVNINDQIILPCIAHVKCNNYNHYVVIYQINHKRKYLLIADPSDSIKKISFKDFFKIWTNILIFLYPVKPILKLEQNIPLSKFVIQSFYNYKKLFLNIVFLSFMVTILSIVNSYSSKYMLDTTSTNVLKCFFIIFLIVNLLKILTEFVRNKLLFYINKQTDYSLSTETYKNIIHLPYHYYHNHTTGEVLSKITDLNNVREAINNIFINLFMDLPLTIIIGIFLYKMSSELFNISLCIFLLTIIIIKIYQKIYIQLIEKIKYSEEENNNYLIETIKGYETIKGLNIEDKVISKYKYKYIQFLNNIFDLQNKINNQTFLKNFIYEIGFLIILYKGCNLVYKNDLTVGSLVAFQSLLIYFLEPIKNTIKLSYQIKEAKISLNRILNLISVKKEQGLNIKVIGSINIKNLKYQYNHDEVLNIKKLIINQGDKVLVIGRSGSGKSTLLKIIMKYYKVNQKQIFIDNIDINEISDTSVRKNICYISQNESIFTDTLFNNLKLNRNISDKKIIEISKICEVDKICNDQLNYFSFIEENGINISGGEKQRIILARTLLRNFSILLIDEGLNQMDVDLERRILKRIFKKYRNKTIIIVSHRLENIDLYDKTINLEKGVYGRNMA